jgi:hypothetical protein
MTIHRVATSLVLSALLVCAGTASAQSTEQDYAAALAALKKGADDEAIDRLELMADQGVVHPGASLARAHAYLKRAEGTRARPGDLGRAAAALTESLLLRPDDERAKHALQAVHAEIARRHAKRGARVETRPRLGRAAVSLLPEQVWAVTACIGSLALALGLMARRLGQSAFVRLSGAVAIALGATVVLVFGLGAWAAWQLRTSSRPAVVIVPEAHLTAEDGRALRANRGEGRTSIPEGATVYVREVQDGRSRVEWGTLEGWLSVTDLRLLPQR